MIAPGALLQILIQRKPLVEDKAFALPQTFIPIRLLQITEDAAFELEDLFKSELLQVRSKLFTPDPASAEHSDLRVSFGIEILRNKRREVTELFGSRIY